MKKHRIIMLSIFPVIVMCFAGVIIANMRHDRYPWKDIFYSCQFLKIHVYKENKDIIITNRHDILMLWKVFNPKFLNNPNCLVRPDGVIAWVGYPYPEYESEGISTQKQLEENDLFMIAIHSNGIVSEAASPVKYAVTLMPAYCSEVLRLCGVSNDRPEPARNPPVNPPGSALFN